MSHSSHVGREHAGRSHKSLSLNIALLLYRLQESRGTSDLRKYVLPLFSGKDPNHDNSRLIAKAKSEVVTDQPPGG